MMSSTFRPKIMEELELKKHGLKVGYYLGGTGA